MTKAEFMELMEAKNPVIFGAATVQIKVANLRDLLEHAFDRGVAHGKESQGASLFESIFGGAK
jgi:hypothetical protein